MLFELSETLVNQIKSTDRAVLGRMLREAEEGVLTELRTTDILTLQTAYRYASMWAVRNNEIPRWNTLPARLKSDPPAVPPDAGLWIKDPRWRRMGRAPLPRVLYAAMVERMERALVMQLFCIKMVTREQFPDDPLLERARRVVIYARQFEEHSRQIFKDDALRCGPKAKRVYCVELQQWFDSSRQAAKFIRQTYSYLIEPADIRTAVKRGCRRAGFTWTRTAPAKRAEKVHTQIDLFAQAAA